MHHSDTDFTLVHRLRDVPVLTYWPQQVDVTMVWIKHLANVGGALVIRDCVIGVCAGTAGRDTGGEVPDDGVVAVAVVDDLVAFGRAGDINDDTIRCLVIWSENFLVIILSSRQCILFLSKNS